MIAYRIGVRSMRVDQLAPSNTAAADLPPRVARNVVFISKATPGDDEFVLWLAPRLEAEGYTVFADILSLEPGSRWRKEVTETLQKRGIKMLLCCRDSTLASEGVQEEIGIAGDLVKELNDPKFIIPLRLEPYKKLFGIGELQRVDFTRGWRKAWASCSPRSNDKGCRAIHLISVSIPIGKYFGGAAPFRSRMSRSAARPRIGCALPRSPMSSDFSSLRAPSIASR